MLRSRHPKHRRWYFFGPYLESLGNRCHLFLHPSAKNSAAAFGWYRDGFFRRLWWWLLREKPDHRTIGIHIGSSCLCRDELRKSFMKHVFFKADQFDSHMPTWMNSFCLTICWRRPFYSTMNKLNLATWQFGSMSCTKTSQTWISAHQKTSPSKTTTIHPALFLVW